MCYFSESVMQCCLSPLDNVSANPRWEYFILKHDGGFDPNVSIGDVPELDLTACDLLHVSIKTDCTSWSLLVQFIFLHGMSHDSCLRNVCVFRIIFSSELCLSYVEWMENENKTANRYDMIHVCNIFWFEAVLFLLFCQKWWFYFALPKHLSSFLRVTSRSSSS